MPPQPSHRRHDSRSQSTHPRASILPHSTSTSTTTTTTNQGNSNTLPTQTSGSTGSASMSTAKTRQFAHLHAQLAQLNANLADTENLLRMTAVQAADMRFLGGYVGALFMGSAKVLGEEGVRGNADGVGAGGKEVKKESEED